MTGPNNPGTAYGSYTGGGSKVCWFTGAELPASTVDLEYPLSLQPYSGPEFDDTRVDADDATVIEVVTAGTYLFNAEATCEAADPTTVNVGAALNGGGWFAGPLGLVKGHTYTAGNGLPVTARVSAVVPLAAGDTVAVTVTASAADVSVTSCNVSLLRVSG